LSAANQKVYELSINSKATGLLKKKEAENGWLLAAAPREFHPGQC